MQYMNIGPDFSITATGKKYKHGAVYDESEIPDTNRAWFKVTDEVPDSPNIELTVPSVWERSTE